MSVQSFPSRRVHKVETHRSGHLRRRHKSTNQPPTKMAWNGTRHYSFGDAGVGSSGRVQQNMEVNALLFFGKIRKT